MRKSDLYVNEKGELATMGFFNGPIEIVYNSLIMSHNEVKFSYVPDPDKKRRRR